MLSPGLTLMVSGWLADASLGAFFARICEMRIAAGRLPALMIFAAGRLLGAQMLPTILFDRLAGGESSKAATFAAIGMIVAAVVVVASQRQARRRI